VRGLANTQLTWSVQEVSGGSVSAAGFYNAPQSTGFYHVVATSVVDASVTASATITVTTLTGRFMPTGSMRSGHDLHTGTLLVNGKVLIAGGAINKGDPYCPNGMASAELYDWAVGSFSQTGSMASPRYAHTATSLLNGEVLVTGGIPSGIDCEDLGTPAVNSAELYDPSHGSFTTTGSMMELRVWHTATLLTDGKVLVAGGTDGNLSTSKTAELYDPKTGAFSSTGDMSIHRSSHTATLLANGKVLIAGGPTAKAEIYDPGTRTFSPTGSMTAARAGHTATLLATGRVLITGGSELATAEVYDPTTGSFAPTGSMGQARSSHTATLLSDGSVLIAGGGDSTAEIYNPSTGSFTPTGGMEIGRAGHTATLLPNGKVLVAGGGDSHHPLATAELYK
jgi:WD40 repeat protein